MRTTSMKALLAVSLLLLLSIFSARPASAQGFQIGTCIGTDGVTFSSGVTTTPTTQGFNLQSIETGCVYITNLLNAPVLAFVNWNSTVYDTACTSLALNLAPGSGTLTWSDKSTRTIVLTGTVASLGIAGLTPTAAFFKITGGYAKGGYFIVDNELVPTIADLTCSTSHPVYILTGPNVPLYVALPIPL